MGRIFSFREIEEGLFPLFSSFDDVANTLSSDIRTTPGICAASFYGSYPKRRFNERSDIDVLVVYDYLYHHAVMEMLRENYARAQSFRVPLNIEVVDTEIARRGMHSLGCSMYNHVCFCAQHGGSILGDVAQGFAFLDACCGDVQSYMKHKLRSFNEQIVALPCMAEDELVHSLQKMLQAPMHTAKKIVCSRFNIGDDSKDRIVKLYPKLASAREIELFERLVAADKQYTLDLHEQLPCPNRERYGETIQALRALIWDVAEFTRLSCLRVA